jgi:transposase
MSKIDARPSVSWTTGPLSICGFVACIVCKLDKVPNLLRRRSGSAEGSLPMADAVSTRRLGSIEGQAGFWAPTEAGWQETDLLYKTITSKKPLQLKFQFALWTHEMVVEFIWKRWRIKLSLASVGRLLAKLGIICQKPLHRTVERHEALTKKWLRCEYSRIKALGQREIAPIFFADATHVRSDHHAVRTGCTVGETPNVATGKGASFDFSLILAITSKEHMRFMITEGGVMGGIFIEFLKRLLTGAEPKVVLIVDRGPAHRAKKTEAFVERLAGTLQLFFLLPYSPDLNPDEQSLEEAYGRTHGDRQQAIFQGRSALLHALAPKYAENKRRVFSEAITQICCVNVDILMN